MMSNMTIHCKFHQILYIAAGILMLGLTVAACGGSSRASSSSTPAASRPSTPADTQPAAASSSSGVTDTEPADAKACSNLQRAFVTFHADQNQTNEDAFAVATIPNATMTQTLYNAFQALNGDVQNAQLSGSADPTAQADEQAVATGCAAAGVTLPSGFTG